MGLSFSHPAALQVAVESLQSPAHQAFRGGLKLLQALVHLVSQTEEAAALCSPRRMMISSQRKAPKATPSAVVVGRPCRLRSLSQECYLHLCEDSRHQELQADP
jgi:hypothetical protein